MFSCNCLNIIIESETNDCQHANLDMLNLSEEEKQDIFFKQHIKQVDKLSRINKEHSGLVASRNVGNWIIHQCINCDVHTHAIHRDRGAACVLVSAQLLNAPLMTTARDSNHYSNIFNILISDQESNTDKQPERLPPDVELALGGLKQRVTELLSREAGATEDRVRIFTEQQYAALDKYREKAHREHKILARIIIEKRYQPMLSSETFSMPSPPNIRLMDNTVPVLTANSNSPSDKTKTKLITKIKSNSNRMSARQMSTPVSYGKSIDSEGLFQLEEMEDIYPSATTEGNDSDNEDSSKSDGSHVTRSKSQPSSIAKSLPVTIPAFMSQFRSRNIDDEHDDIVLHEKDQHPSDIAASIKALAKSVHGDTVFGDLPRPRFSTQI